MDCYGYNRVGSCSALTTQICKDGTECPFHKPRKQYIAELYEGLKTTTNAEYVDCVAQIIKEQEKKCGL